MKNLKTFCRNYIRVNLINKYLFHAINYGEIFFLLMIIKFFVKDEIDVLFPLDVFIIYVSVYIIVLLPLGGFKGLKEKFERKYGSITKHNIE